MLSLVDFKAPSILQLHKDAAHSRQITWLFLVLLAAVAIAVAIYGTIALTRLQHYHQLDSTIPPTQISWQIKRVKSDRYHLEASYRYRVAGKEYRGNFKDKTRIRNRYAAEEMLRGYEERSWKLWYASQSPKRSTLQKSFPFKECLSAGLLLVVLIYFLGLGIYLAKQTG